MPRSVRRVAEQRLDETGHGLAEDQVLVEIEMHAIDTARLHELTGIEEIPLRQEPESLAQPGVEKLYNFCKYFSAQS